MRIPPDREACLSAFPRFLRSRRRILRSGVPTPACDAAVLPPCPLFRRDHAKSQVAFLEAGRAKIMPIGNVLSLERPPPLPLEGTKKEKWMRTQN